MGKYILKRVGYMFLTLFVVVTITFFLMRAIPGDPLATMARALPEQTRQAFYARYGLDRPLFEQYLTYMKTCSGWIWVKVCCTPAAPSAAPLPPPPPSPAWWGASPCLSAR